MLNTRTALKFSSSKSSIGYFLELNSFLSVFCAEKLSFIIFTYGFSFITSSSGWGNSLPLISAASFLAIIFYPVDSSIYFYFKFSFFSWIQFKLVDPITIPHKVKYSKNTKIEPKPHYATFLFSATESINSSYSAEILTFLKS